MLAFAHGAAPEIVEHGRTGFLVDDEHEMAAVVPRAGGIDAMECRRSAERFAPERVAERYEAVYHERAWSATRTGTDYRPAWAAPQAR